jgi:sec-independent protein translocase protein TatB
MFDVGWSEMAAIAVIVLVVLGPKELPHALKSISHWMRAARKLGNEFQSGVNEIVREAELDDAKKELQKLSASSIRQKIEKEIDPGGDLKKTISASVAETKSGLNAPAEPAAAPERAAELPPFPGFVGSETGASAPSSTAEPPSAVDTDTATTDDNKPGKSVSV